MTDGLTRKVLDFLRWRTLEEHSTGLREIKHLAYRERKKALNEERENIICAQKDAVRQIWEEGQKEINFSMDTKYMH